MQIQQYSAKPFMDRRFILGEGPVYIPGEDMLMWVDIKAGALFTWDFQSEELEEIQTGQYLGAAAPTQSGKYLTAMTTGVYLLSDQGLQLVCRPPLLTHNLRLNDAKCDPVGRFFFGTISLFDGNKEEGSLFCMEKNGRCSRLLAGTENSNGMAWSGDGKTMYYIDTETGGVDAFDYDVQTAGITNRRRIYTVEDGKPDGMTIDAEGMLWVALWGGGKVVRIDPAKNTAIGQVTLPCENVTSCCFGGLELDKLYITTSGEGFTEPEAGKIYVADPKVKGLPPVLFNDEELPVN